MTETELRGIADRLSDYTPCLDPGVATCDRRAVDEAVAALRAQADATHREVFTIVNPGFHSHPGFTGQDKDL
jgi:RNase P/RNase MRP subunit POP5